MDFFDRFLGASLGINTEIDGLRQAARTAARQHAGRVRDIRERMDDLEDWIAEISLLNQTLLRLLLSRGSFTKEDFHAVFREIDLLDGVQDGKLAKPPLAKAASGREGRGEGTRAPEGNAGKPHGIRRHHPRA
jgi:hypothetical protein